MTTLTLSVWLSKLPLFVLCFLLRSQINGLFSNLMSIMFSSMTFLLNMFIWNNPGYIDPRFPTHICLLKKALYGLKHAPHAWFQCLFTLGFSCSRADSSLLSFINNITLSICFFMLMTLLLTATIHLLLTTLLASLF